MIKRVSFLILCFLCVALTACSSGRVSLDSNSASINQSPNVTKERAAVAPRNSASVVHAFVALCDNVYQGIVPVSASLGDGDNPKTNLYWGAAFGLRTFFSRDRNWKLVAEFQNPQPAILERLVLRHKVKEVFLVADAYRGKEIKQTTIDFLEAAAGKSGEEVSIRDG